jgi:hypothetical protein
VPQGDRPRIRAPAMKFFLRSKVGEGCDKEGWKTGSGDGQDGRDGRDGLDGRACPERSEGIGRPKLTFSSRRRRLPRADPCFRRGDSGCQSRKTSTTGSADDRGRAARLLRRRRWRRLAMTALAQSRGRRLVPSSGSQPQHRRRAAKPSRLSSRPPPVLTTPQCPVRCIYHHKQQARSGQG